MHKFDDFKVSSIFRNSTIYQSGKERADLCRNEVLERVLRDLKSADESNVEDVVMNPVVVQSFGKPPHVIEPSY